MIDFPIEGATTCSLSGGNFSWASMVFMVCPFVSKSTETSKVSPTVTFREVGLTNNEAPCPSSADAISGVRGKIKIPKTTRKISIFLEYTLTLLSISSRFFFRFLV